MVIGMIALGAFPVAAKGGGQNGTTLAAYKTIDICDNGDGTWTYSGEIAVWNEGAAVTQGLAIKDCIQFKSFDGGGQFADVEGLCEDLAVTEIPAGTTLETATVFNYEIVGEPLLDGYIRNSAYLTILNHSGHLGTPWGPNPKASYAGEMPPPPCEQDMGCTLTQGYWGTHSNYGPAAYDPNWATIGEDTSFFLSGTTWYGAITTVPKGNGYWILSNQYVAAILNQNNGAYVPSGVQDILDAATAWFAGAVPDNCSAGGSCGLQKDWAAVLDTYNNGIYPGGPGHCE